MNVPLCLNLSKYVMLADDDDNDDREMRSKGYNEKNHSYQLVGGIVYVDHCDAKNNGTKVQQQEEEDECGHYIAYLHVNHLQQQKAHERRRAKD
eukprot:2486498-Ditylum_brightwellii.AAC.1